jgi:mannose-6-phosphate isomerase-like protein (cupin superfamily)
VPLRTFEPSLPSAVRVDFGMFLIVCLRLAPACARFTLRLAALRCRCVAMALTYPGPYCLRMTDYAIRRLEEIPDVLGDYPGEMRMTAASDLGGEQISFTWRRMPARTGGKGSYGHRHKTQEEIYFVASGTLQFKLEHEVIDVGPGTVVRIAPHVVRSVWNEGPDDAILIMCSTKSGDPQGDHEQVPDFWPE